MRHTVSTTRVMHAQIAHYLLARRCEFHDSNATFIILIKRFSLTAHEASATRCCAQCKAITGTHSQHTATQTCRLSSCEVTHRGNHITDPSLRGPVMCWGPGCCTCAPAGCASPCCTDSASCPCTGPWPPPLPPLPALAVAVLPPPLPVAAPPSFMKASSAARSRLSSSSFCSRVQCVQVQQKCTCKWQRCLCAGTRQRHGERARQRLDKQQSTHSHRYNGKCNMQTSALRHCSYHAATSE